MNMKQSALTVLFAFGVVACGSGTKKATVPGAPAAIIRSDYAPGEIMKLTEASIKKLDKQIAEILKVPAADKNFANTILPFETVTAEFGDEGNLYTFMNAVGVDKKLRDEALASEMKFNEYSVGLGSRRDIYDAFVQAYKNTPKSSMKADDIRLTEETIKDFKRNGLSLPDNELEEVKKLQLQLSKMTTDFGNNIKESVPELEISPTLLAGVPDDFMKDLEKNSKQASGKYKIKINASSYTMIMDNCTVAETRKEVQRAYENRAAVVNTSLLVQIITLRQEIAKKLHYKTWADYKTERRMAGNGQAALDFLNGLRSKLAIKNKQDLQAMLKFKKTYEPKATVLNAWDTRFIDTQMKKKFYSLDDEKIKEFFPADQTVLNMFKIYSQLFGLKFSEVANAPVWHPSVKLYEIRNSADDSFVGNFYTDFVPREGKYNHFAAFNVLPGRLLTTTGEYKTPTAVIVGNFSPPLDGKPSMLTHDEVETLFHEFGHIMHQTLTKAPYATLSGSSVARDFVEAPSQVLENWVWDAKMLDIISGHYKNPAQKLPADIVKKLLASKKFNRGFFNTRQLLLGSFDMSLHTATGPVTDPTALYIKLYKEITGMQPLPDTHFPAGFGHLMGYDAGYYGYLWSLVYADDMFTVFKKEGLLSAKAGMSYRQNILERGNSEDASILLEKFLGRKPNNKAFLNNLFGK